MALALSMYTTGVASTKEATLIGRILDIVRSGRGSDFVTYKEREECNGYAV
jgi:hypothetical protein